MRVIPLEILAAEQETASPIAIAALLVLITGGIIFRFGYLRAVHQRARGDYLKVKQGLPGMRKSMSEAFWGFIKLGVIVVIGIGLLLAWAGSDVLKEEDRRPVPAKISPAPRR